DFSDWSVAGDSERLVLSATDTVADLSISIEIAVFDPGVLSMQTTLRNDGETTYSLDRCMAASMLTDAGPAEITSFTGMWGREFHAQTERLGRGVWLQENRRGRTSHDRFPGLFIASAGMARGIHLGWSGNHVIAVDT